MLLITSANGNVGSHIVPYLAKKGFKIRAIDINPAVERYKNLGVEVMTGDARESNFLKKAVNGCDEVLYIPPLFTYQETMMANLAVDIAVEVGVKKYIQLSVIHPHMNTLLQHTMKLNAERHLIYTSLKTGLNYTILQPVTYHHNIHVDSLLKTEKFYSVNGLNSRLAYVDAYDVAEVVAKILRENNHNCATYQLCGPDYMTPVECAELFSKISGVHVEAENIPAEKIIESWPEHMKNDSYSCEAFKALQYTYTNYGFSGNKNVLEWLLGHPAIDFGEYFRKELKRYGYEVKS